jgi:hypothetical protein
LEKLNTSLGEQGLLIEFLFFSQKSGAISVKALLDCLSGKEFYLLMPIFYKAGRVILSSVDVAVPAMMPEISGTGA